jgi:hypothetical protein
MTDQLARVRADLATLRLAAGLDPTWDRGAVRTHALLAGAGLASALWAALSPDGWQLAGMAAFVVPVVDWARRIRRPSERAAAEEQEWRDSVAVLWYVIPLSLLAWWSPRVGLSLEATGGLMCFLMGFVLFGSAVSERNLRALLGWAIALMAGGLFGPLGIAPLLPVVAAAIALGATITGLWIAVELRAKGELG